MNRQDVIECMLLIKSLKPTFFDKFSKERKEEMVHEWVSVLPSFDKENVMPFISSFIRETGRVPYPSEIIKNVNPKDEWHSKYGYGNEPIRLSSTDYDNAFRWNDEHQCWGMQLIPDDILKRIVHDPTLNTEEEEAERQRLLKIALEKQGE